MIDKDNAQVEGGDVPKRKPGRPPKAETAARVEPRGSTVVVRVKQNVADPDHWDDRTLQLHERKLWAGTKERPRYAEVPEKWAQAHIEHEHVVMCSKAEAERFHRGELRLARVRGGNAPTVGLPED